MGQPPGYAPAANSILPDDQGFFITLLVMSMDLTRQPRRRQAKVRVNPEVRARTEVEQRLPLHPLEQRLPAYQLTQRRRNPRPPGVIFIRNTTDLRVIAQPLGDGVTELALQQFGADACGDWGPAFGRWFFRAESEDWVFGNSLTVRAPGADDSAAGTVVRSIGRLGSKGRVEVALELETGEDEWVILYPKARYVSTDAKVGTWKWSGSLTVSVPDWRTPFDSGEECEEAE